MHHHSHLARVFSLATHAALALGLAVMWPAQAQTVAQPAAPAASAAQTVRPAVGTALQAAQAALQQGKPQDALAKLKEAEAVGGLTPYEKMVVERTRAVAAQAAGDRAATAAAIEAALATGAVPPADELALVEALVGTAARLGDHPRVVKWSARYFELGGTGDGVRNARLQSQLAAGDDKGALASFDERAAADEKAGRPVAEGTLRGQLYLQRKLADAAADRTLEKLAAAYPRPEYWSEMVSAAARRASGNDRVLIEHYRLLRAVGALTSAGLAQDLAELALRLGQPVEARAVVEEAYASGLFGAGASAAEHQKLRDSARKQAEADIADRAAAETAARRAADGTALADLGWSIVAGLPRTGAPAGEAERGASLIEQGVAKGGLRRPTDTRLHLGIAQIAAGRKDAARKTLTDLASSAGADPLAEPVRLWGLWAGAAAPLPPYKP